MIKKFSGDPQVWYNYASFLFDGLAAPQRGRDLLARALMVLPRHHHVDITSRFAQLEFRSANGNNERGRTIFEGLFTTFPKRLDQWNILIDLEKKFGAKEQVTKLFDRVTSGKLKTRKAHYFFKKWLEYEEEQGDTKTIGKVKAKAEEFVRDRTAS